MWFGNYSVIFAVLVLAAGVQVLAAILALRLIPVSRGWIAWLLIATAMLLRASRTIIALITVQGDPQQSIDAVEHWLSLAVSVALAAGMWAIGPLFRAYRRALAQAEEANSDLQRRTLELEAANREMETFSYSVAHDLRSPLRSVDGFSKYLLEHNAEQLDVRGQDYLHRMRAAAQRMGRLIDDLLNLARVGRVALKRERVDISALAASTVVELRRRDPERSVTVTIAPNLTASGDPELLSLVLGNLLDNAWKFTSRQADARITVGEEMREGTRSFFVRDNGAGFDMAYANKLFLPFQRLHTEEEFPGSGIGLALVRRIIERHGGRIWAEGAEGQGATFYFTLGE